MAKTKENKQTMVDLYGDWLEKSRAVVVTEYTGLTMKRLDDLRSKLREVGGEFHIVKNTLGKLALESKGFKVEDEIFTGSTAFGFGFEDAPALAKVISEFAKESDFVKIKAGYLGKKQVGPDDVRALAELPPLPVMRAMLLGTLLAPASQLARTLAEPGRQIAAVVKAYATADDSQMAAAAE